MKEADQSSRRNVISVTVNAECLLKAGKCIIECYNASLTGERNYCEYLAKNISNICMGKYECYQYQEDHCENSTVVITKPIYWIFFGLNLLVSFVNFRFINLKISLMEISMQRY